MTGGVDTAAGPGNTMGLGDREGFLLLDADPLKPFSFEEEFRLWSEALRSRFRFLFLLSLLRGKF